MIEVGVIVKPQGIKGEVKILTQQQPKAYVGLSRIYVEGKEFQIQSLSARDALYVVLDGVSTRNEAELLRGKTCFAEKSELASLKENEFYFDDLIGKEVFDQNNNFVGKVEDIEKFGAADIVVIRERNMLFSVPFIDSIFKEIQNGKIVVASDEYDNLKINY